MVVMKVYERDVSMAAQTVELMESLLVQRMVATMVIEMVVLMVVMTV